MGARNWARGGLLAGCLLGGITAFCACAPAVIWQGRSPDHTRYAEIRTDGPRQFVELDGVRGPSYQGIAEFGILFSPTGGHLAYPALDGGRWFMVRAGRPGPAWDGISDPVFSPDGRHLAYAALRDSLWFVVLDSLVSTPFDSLAGDGLLFSPDSERLAFAAWQGGSLRLVVDGLPETASFTAIGDIRFSPDSSTLIGLGYRQDEVCLVVDGQERCCARLLKHPAVNHDGSRTAVAARDDAGWFLWQDGAKTGPHDDVRFVGFEPCDSRLILITVSAAGEQMVVDGVPGPVWDEVSAPVFSARGGRLGYIAAVADSQAVVVDGNVLARHFWASDLVFDPEGRELAYLAETDGRAVIMHRGPGSTFPLIVGGSLVFSADGQHLGCLAGDPVRKKLFLVVDGNPTDRTFSWGEYTSAMAPDAVDYARGEPATLLLRSWVLGAMAHHLAAGD